MSGRLVLVLEGAPRPADARVLGPNGRAHWAAKRQARRRLQLHLWTVARVMYGTMRPAAFERVRIQYILTVPDRRRRDADNFLGGCGKAWTDALVAMGVMPDDDTAHVEYAPVEWIVAPGQRRTEIVVDALGGRGRGAMSNGAWDRYILDLDEQRAIEQDEANPCECSYGYFLGGDPRQFSPDEKYCTPDEIARWQALCAEWEDGRPLAPPVEEHGPWMDPKTGKVFALGERPVTTAVGLCHAPRSLGIGVTTCDRCWRDREGGAR